MDAIKKLLTRGVDSIYPTREALKKVLRSGKKLTLYQGFDPTGTQLHLGHAVAFRKLRQWQDLGHHVIFLIGDGTGQAGDPSGKKKTREKFMTNDELRSNAKNYVMQASKIIKFDGDNPVEIKYNSEWLNKLSLIDILDIAGHFTWQQLSERDLYQERIKNKIDLNFREALYPLLQGYDSVALNVDLEVGGTDQTFNMLAGRQLAKQMLGKEKFVMTLPLLTDARGVKIGKTEKNVIGLTDEPSDFYGKIMALGDDAIIPCFTLLTDKPLEEITKYEVRMKNGENPMQFKKQLAYELTKWLNDEHSAGKAQEDFENRFQKGDVHHADIHTYPLPAPDMPLADTLVELGFASSRSDAKRLLQQKSVKINGNITEKKDAQQLKTGDIIEVGRKAVKIDS